MQEAVLRDWLQPSRRQVVAGQARAPAAAVGAPMKRGLKRMLLDPKLRWSACRSWCPNERVLKLETKPDRFKAGTPILVYAVDL